MHTLQLGAGEDSSPVLPAWFEQDLYPGRGEPSLPLQRGYKPFQLPHFADGSHAACHDSHSDAAHGQAELMTPASLIDANVLRKSEFFLPLDNDALALQERLLARILS
jgi:hypothetical protein